MPHSATNVNLVTSEFDSTHLDRDFYLQSEIFIAWPVEKVKNWSI